MFKEQSHTPKYWVGHCKRNSDVILNTASKRRGDTEEMMTEFFGNRWLIDDDYEVILIEIKEVELL